MPRFWEPLAPLREAGRLGPVFCLPPESFERDDAALDEFLAALPDARHCLELATKDGSPRRSAACWSAIGPRSTRGGGGSPAGACAARSLVYLNDDWEGFAPANAAYLRRAFGR